MFSNFLLPLYHEFATFPISIVLLNLLYLPEQSTPLFEFPSIQSRFLTTKLLFYVWGLIFVPNPLLSESGTEEHVSIRCFPIFHFIASCKYLWFLLNQLKNWMYQQSRTLLWFWCFICLKLLLHVELLDFFGETFSNNMSQYQWTMKELCLFRREKRN